ncbi:MAG: penicillin-binding protein 2 [Verrucomicrobiae bacterium]|nr:penicillin-binding protein 2 [Verrucomicrobiae bacterium]
MVTHFRLRLYLLALLILGGFGVLVTRLHQVQIEEGESFVSKLPGRKYETVRIPGIRGEIKDRNGIVMVENISNYEVRFDLKAIRDDYVEKHGTVPKRKWVRYRGAQPVEEEETDIVAIVEQSVFPGLGDLGLLEDYNAKQMQVHYRSTGGVVPYTYRRDLTFEDFAAFAEHNIGIPGVTVTVTGRRHYLYDSLACHILGRVNLPDIDKVPAEKRNEFRYYVGDDYGVEGVEKTMDHYLQGVPGKRVLVKDEKGKFIGDENDQYQAPGAGADVYLTIDAKIQSITEESLRKVGRGAAVVIDPNSGDVLAMASVPSFNPNVFIPEISVSDWNRYTQDKTSPMFNRAVNPNAPGSTYKIPIALAGCLSKSWQQRFVCGAGAQYGNKFMKCWCASKGYTHGSPDLGEAIKLSCNGFFYRYANHTGIRNIQTMSNLLGLGRPTGIQITGEQPGTAPGPEWMRMQGLTWTESYTAMTGIGQGFVEATPLQMASVVATLANGGKVYTPRIVKKVIRRDGEVVWEEPPTPRHDLLKEGLTAEQIETVKRGMWRVVNESGGTAGRVASKVTVISGKTGTAQTGIPSQPTNSWFISFAPYEKPEVAVCVFVENGKSGGGVAAPIAKNIIEQTIAMRRGQHDIKLTQLQEAKGSLDFYESVSFEGEGVVIASSDDPDNVNVGDVVPQSLRLSGGSSNSGVAQPSIRRNADAEGSVSGQNTDNRRKFRPFKFLGIKR